MKNWFLRFAYQFAQWMQGRYGVDELSRFLSVFAFILLFLSALTSLLVLNILALLLLFYTLYRTFSRKLEARRKERDFYLRITTKWREKWKIYKLMWKERKTHVYYKCPKCKRVVRVPKGKGHMTITCPQCGNRFDKKT